MIKLLTICAVVLLLTRKLAELMIAAFCILLFGFGIVSFFVNLPTLFKDVSKHQRTAA